MYNLALGLSYLFEDESAIVIGAILGHKRGTSFTIEDICKRSQFDLSDLEDFIVILIENGLLSLDDLKECSVKSIRQIVSKEPYVTQMTATTL